jgi:hypothetical protein
MYPSSYGAAPSVEDLVKRSIACPNHHSIALLQISILLWSRKIGNGGAQAMRPNARYIGDVDIRGSRVTFLMDMCLDIIDWSLSTCSEVQSNALPHEYVNSYVTKTVSSGNVAQVFLCHFTDQLCGFYRFL